jgi:dTMP kinase
MKIAIEGIDGTGKGLLIEKLKELLPAHGIEAVFSAEPTPAGRKRLKAAAKRGTLQQDAESIFISDRAKHIKELTPAFNEGKPVIIDRHMLSTIAYQGIHKGFDPGLLAQNQLERFAPADLTILLDMPVEEALERIAKPDRREADAADKEFEKVENLRKTRTLYHDFLGLTSIRSIVIDARRPPDTVAAIALKAILFVIKGEGYMPQSIFCVPTQILKDTGIIRETDSNPDNKKYPKFRKLNSQDKKMDKLKEALAHGLWKERVLAEEDTNFKQIIPSIIVTDPEGKILYYIRQGKEKRLHKKMAVTLGGHIDPEDVAGAPLLCNPKMRHWHLIMAAAKRELQEEMGNAALHCSELSVLGIVNYDVRPPKTPKKNILVGQVHLGLVMICVCRQALNFRNSEELGIMRTEKLSVLKKDARAETWAAAILATL